MTISDLVASATAAGINLHPTWGLDAQPGRELDAEVWLQTHGPELKEKHMDVRAHLIERNWQRLKAAYGTRAACAAAP